MITKITDFNTRPINVPGLLTKSGDEYTDAAMEMQEAIEQYIALYEPKYIGLLLSDKTDEDIDKLENAICDMAINPIAMYVYFHYIRDNTTVATISGEKTKTAQSSIVSSPAVRLTGVWNMMAQITTELASALSMDDVAIVYNSELFHTVNEMNL